MNHVDTTQQPQKIISFCSGILGLERGLKRAGLAVQPVVYLEIEAFATANLVAGMEAGMVDPCPIWTDLKTFDARPFRGKVQGIIGGYPCQPFSQNGKRRGENDPRHLWPYISRHVKTVEPLWCFFENVPGHLTCGYIQVRKELEEMDFSVKEGIYSAAECGASIQRERLFILAFSNRSRGWKDWQPSQPWASGVKQSPCNQGGVYQGSDEEKQGTRWPAGPYSEQYEWESPRTLKPGMGCEFNGYNFRNDLLHAIGNSVVEQTAAVAFIDLLNKHLRD